jgi:hypothetical protein
VFEQTLAAAAAAAAKAPVRPSNRMTGASSNERRSNSSQQITSPSDINQPVKERQTVDK